MDPNGNNPEPQNQLPAHSPVTPTSGSDWQKEALAAARMGAQPAAAPPANPAVNPGVNPGDAALRVPDWQRGFQHHPAPQGADAQGSDVPDMLAPADPVPSSRPAAPQSTLPQLPDAPEVNPMPGARYGQPIVSSASSSDMQAASAVDPGGPKSAKKILLIVLIAAAAIVISSIVYFVVFAGSDSVKEVNEQSNNSADSSAVDLATVGSVTFTPPDLTGYTKDPSSSSETYASYTNSDNTCSLGFGTVAAGTLPGTTVEEMVDAQVKSVTDLGATADGPHVAEALVLPDAEDPKVKYKVPTMSFTFSKDNASGKVLYSIVILKDTRLAIVNRQCGNQNGSVSDAALEAVEKKAKELQVSVGQTP